jgi:hypothetical protein
MKRIGFIDYYIDEWHANNYPAWIRGSSLKGEFDVTLAWEEASLPGKKPIEQWCREQNVKHAPDLETVVRECDCLVVLSPDNAERHEALSDLPLRSGKPVYIDKPFASSLAEARRMAQKAARYNTPLMSSSALRFGSALQDTLVNKIAGKPVRFSATRGGGVFSIYAIHQLEMLVMTLGTGASRVMQCGNKHSNLLVIKYPDDRCGTINLIPDHPFQISTQYGDNKLSVIDKMDDFFPLFIEAMLKFFKTGVSPVPLSQTLEIAAILEAGTLALANPDTWISLPAE